MTVFPSGYVVWDSTQTHAFCKLLRSSLWDAEISCLCQPLLLFRLDKINVAPANSKSCHQVLSHYPHPMTVHPEGNSGWRKTEYWL